MSTGCCRLLPGGTPTLRVGTAIATYQEPLLEPSHFSVSKRSFLAAVSPGRGWAARKQVHSSAFTQEAHPRKAWQVQASANYVLDFVTETIWPAVTSIASYAFGLPEHHREAPPVTNSNNFVLHWVITVIANRLQLSPGDVLLDTKLEDMVFLGGHCDSNFRTVEILMDIEDLFSVIYPHYVDILASYTVRELADMIASQYLVGTELQPALLDPYNYNLFLLERMLQSAIGSALNIKKPLKLDTKLSSLAANPRLLKESLRDLEGKFGLRLDYCAYKDLTIRNIAKRILTKYEFNN